MDFEKLKMMYKLGKGLTLSDVQVLFQSAKKRSYPIGACLIQEGRVTKDVFLIRKGLVRAYKINKRGDEVTTMMRCENQIIASPDAIFFNQQSQFYYEALEATDVFSMDYDVLQNVISNNPKLESNRKFILQNILKETLKRIDSFVLLSPEERYLEFIKDNPALANRVPDKHIANVLGFTPVSLSRIRKRIVSKTD